MLFALELNQSMHLALPAWDGGVTGGRGRVDLGFGKNNCQKAARRRCSGCRQFSISAQLDGLIYLATGAALRAAAVGAAAAALGAAAPTWGRRLLAPRAVAAAAAVAA